MWENPRLPHKSEKKSCPHIVRLRMDLEEDSSLSEDPTVSKRQQRQVVALKKAHRLAVRFAHRPTSSVLENSSRTSTVQESTRSNWT